MVCGTPTRECRMLQLEALTDTVGSAMLHVATANQTGLAEGGGNASESR